MTLQPDQQHDLRRLRAGMKPTWRNRKNPIRRIVMHYTGQKCFDPRFPESPRGNAHRCIHNWFANPECGVSVHAVIDPWKTAICLPDNLVANGAAAGNRHEYHIEMACNGEWSDIRAAGLHDAWLQRAAEHAAQVALAHQIPIVHLDPATWRENSGIIGHGEIQPADRTDPGPDFAWNDFIRMVTDAAIAATWPAPSKSPANAQPVT